MNKLRNIAIAAGAALLPALAHAQEASAEIPSPADMIAKIALIGGVAGAAAVLGFSIWSYVKAKRKGGQALS